MEAPAEQDPLLDAVTVLRECAQALVLPLYAPNDQIAASKAVGGLGFEPTAGVPGSASSVWLAR